MANIKNITKKLVNAGYSEDKIMMMTEKQIREAFKTLKEESIMKNHANEVETINSETTVETVEKEETTMRTTDELLYDALTITKVQDKNYVTNAMLRNEYNRITGDVIGFKKTRPVIIKAIQDAIGEIKVICENRLDDAGNINTTEKRFANAVEAEKYALEAAEYNSVISVRIIDGENISIVKPESVSVGDLDITHDNAPEPIEESPATVVFDDGLALKILEGVIRQADTNKAHNFISDWMLTSIISELVLGHPLKDKGHEYYKSFTDEQRKILVDMRKAFINKTHLVTKTNNGKVTGYYIPAKVLVWGRHVHLGVACVYRYVNNNKILAEYHVSLNGIKNVATGNVTVLDDAAYETLDTKCVFVM